MYLYTENQGAGELVSTSSELIKKKQYDHSVIPGLLKLILDLAHQKLIKFAKSTDFDVSIKTTFVLKLMQHCSEPPG